MKKIKNKKEKKMMIQKKMKKEVKKRRKRRRSIIEKRKRRMKGKNYLTVPEKIHTENSSSGMKKKLIILVPKIIPVSV